MKENRKPNCKCLQCGSAIYRRPRELKHNVFCSKKCYTISTRKEHPCVVCGALILASKHAKTCSRKCANVNRKGIKYDTGGLKDKASQSKILRTKLITIRGNGCELCGYDNLNVLQIHHVVHKSKGGSDELTNLKLLCPNCHYTEHLGDSRKI